MEITPTIKIVFAFFLGLGSMMDDTAIKEMDTVLATISLIGLAIFLNWTRQQMSQGGKDINNPFRK
jgi:hypothetical protein